MKLPPLGNLITPIPQGDCNYLCVLKYKLNFISSKMIKQSISGMF